MTKKVLDYALKYFIILIIYIILKKIFNLSDFNLLDTFGVACGIVLYDGLKYLYKGLKSKQI